LSRGSDTLEKALKIISFRTAVKIEHPEGIPLAKKFEDFHGVWDGKLLLTYEPPVVLNSEINVAVVGRLNGINESFSGPLESKFAGDLFTPSQDLVNSIKSMVERMATDIEQATGEKQANNTVSEVVEEILNYAIVNVPIREIYESIRRIYPIEFRKLNLDYKRRNNTTLLEDAEDMLSRQQDFRFGSLIRLIKTAFKKDEILVLDTEKLKNLKEKSPKLHQQIVTELQKIKPINNKYIAYQDSKGDGTFIVGTNAESKSGYSRTDIPIPNILLERPGQIEDLMRHFGDSPEEAQKKQHKQELSQQKAIEQSFMQDLAKYQIPAEVMTDVAVARKYLNKLTQMRKLYEGHNKPLPQKFTNMLDSISAESQQQQQDSKKNVETMLFEQNIPLEVFQDDALAAQNFGKLNRIYQQLKKQNQTVPKEFGDLLSRTLRNIQNSKQK
jgi:hypothetical protein